MSHERQPFRRVPDPLPEDSGDIVEGPPRRSTVVIGISAAVILLAAIVALFAYRSLMGREPPHVAVIKGTEQWLGAHLTITGESLAEPYTAVVERTDRYSVPFFLPAGEYTLVVRRDGLEAHRQQFRLGETRSLEIPLPSVSDATKPAHDARASP